MKLNRLTKMFQGAASALVLLGLVLPTSASANSTLQQTSASTIPEVAEAAGTFTTLLAAVEAAGLTAALGSASPITIFAPTDAAFEKLPPGMLDDLLKPENRADLIAVLTYHAVRGNVKAADLVALSGDIVETVQGESISIRAVGNNVTANDAAATVTNIVAKNGVIHVIDTVLVPPSLAGEMASVIGAVGDEDEGWSLGNLNRRCPYYQCLAKSPSTSQLLVRLERGGLSVCRPAPRPGRQWRYLPTTGFCGL